MTLQVDRYLLTISGPAAQVDRVVDLLRGDGVIQWAGLQQNLVRRMDAEYLHLPADLMLDLREAMLQTWYATLDAARRNPYRQPLDFRGIKPIPGPVLWGGIEEGLAWCLKNWGCLPLTKPGELEITTDIITVPVEAVPGEKRGRGRPRVNRFRRKVATYGFEADGGRPRPIANAIRKAWPDLYVSLERDRDEVEDDGRVLRRRAA